MNALILDEFGNYVLSHVLLCGTYEDKVYIIDKILDDIVQLSLHKFGSNVVEKCLELSPEDKRELILDRIVGVPVSNHRLTLIDLMNSQYANYVVQRTFEMSNPVRRGILVYKIEQVLLSGKLIPNKHSKHVVNFLIKSGIELKVPNLEHFLAEPAQQTKTSVKPKKEKVDAVERKSKPASQRPSGGKNMSTKSVSSGKPSIASSVASHEEEKEPRGPNKKEEDETAKKRYRRRTKAIFVPTKK